MIKQFLITLGLFNNSEAEAPAEISLFTVGDITSLSFWVLSVEKLGYKSTTLQWNWMNMQIWSKPPPPKKTSEVCHLSKSPIRD